jgi:O-antigen/teichoic acid export membrane protein
MSKAGSALRGLWSEDGTLGQKAVRSSAWVMGSMGVVRVLGMAQTIIMVRLLVPSDFGIMSIAGFLLGAVGTFTETGLGAAVIQRRQVGEETLNTAWTIQFLRNLVLFLAILFLAPWAAAFYKNPVLCPILRFVSLRYLLRAFNNIGLCLLEKELSYRRLVLLEVITNVVSVALSVTAAFLLHSVWALAIGWVALAAVTLVGSYAVHPYRPRFALRRQEARKLFGFGLNLTLTGILIFLSIQGDNAVVGKVLGLTALGFYSLAYNLSNLPQMCISKVLGSVALPAYSKMQADRERLANVFSTMLTVVTVLAVPASVGLFVLAPDVVKVVYGAKYLPMVRCFRVLIVYGLLRALAAVVGPMFVGTGRPRLDLITQVVRFSILAVGIYPATRAWGITGAAVSTLISMSAATAWVFWRARQDLGPSVLVNWAKDLGIATVAVATMAALVLAVRTVFTVSVGGLALSVGTGLLVYFGMLWLIWPQIVARGRSLVAKVLA